MKYTFLDYVLKYKNNILNEEIHQIIPENNRTSVEFFKQLLLDIENKEDVYIKVLVKSNNLIKAYNSDIQFHCDRNNSIDLEYQMPNNTDSNETTAQQLYDDILAMENQGNINMTNRGLKIFKHGSSDYKDPIVYFNDETNMIFICIGFENIQSVQTFVNSLISIWQSMNQHDNGIINLKNDWVVSAIQQYANSPVILSILSSMVSNSTLNRNANQQQQIAANQEDQTEIDADDIEDEIENVQNQDQDSDQVPEQNDQEDSDEQQVDTNQEDQQQNNGEQINGMSYLGIWDGVFPFQGYQVMLTKSNEQDFKTFLRSIDQNLKTAFGNFPIKWKQIDGQNSTKSDVTRIKLLSYYPDGSLNMFYMNGKHPLLIKILDFPKKSLQSILSQSSDVWRNQIWPVVFNGFNKLDGSIYALYDKDRFFRDKKGWTADLPFLINKKNNPGPLTSNKNPVNQNIQRNTPVQSRRTNQNIQNQTITLQNNIDRIMNNLGLGIKAEIILKSTGRPKMIPKDDNKYFRVKLIGVNSQKVLIGAEAISFLQEFGLWENNIQTAYQAIEQEIPGIKLIITFNSKII